MNWKFFAFLIVLLLCIENALGGRDYYKILGVPKNANDKQIKRAYHKLSLKYHPDKNKAKDSQDKFIAVSNAYEVLSDPEKRKVYDQFGEEGLGVGGGSRPGGGEQAGGPGSGFRFHNFQGSGGGAENVNFDFKFTDPFKMFSDFFNSFGGGDGAAGAAAGGIGDIFQQFAGAAAGAGPGGARARSGAKAGGRPGQGGAKMGGGIPGFGGMGGFPGMGGMGGMGGGRPGNMGQGQGAGAGGLYDVQGDVYILSDKNINTMLKDDKHVYLVQFYSAGCGHCHRLAPTYKKLAQKLKGIVRVAAIECNQNQQAAQRFGIRGFPTIKLFAKKGSPSDYNGDRSLKSLYDFATSSLPNKVQLISTTLTPAKFFSSNPSVPHVLLIAAKPGLASSISPLYKVVALAFDGQAVFAQASAQDKNVIKEYPTKKFPTLIAKCGGETYKFEGENKSADIAKWLRSSCGLEKSSTSSSSSSRKSSGRPSSKPKPRKPAPKDEL